VAAHFAKYLDNVRILFSVAVNLHVLVAASYYRTSLRGASSLGSQHDAVRICC